MIKVAQFIRLIRLILGLFGNIIYFSLGAIPKKENIWLFSAWNGKKFLDNPKYIYLRCLAHEKNTIAVWVSRDNATISRLKRSGYPAESLTSLRGIWLQLRAGVVVFTHSVEWDFCAPLIGKKTKRVQTWHGIPIKKIGFDDRYGISPDRQKFIERMFPFRTGRLDLVIAASETDKQRYADAFGVPTSIVKITGYPRNDIISRRLEKIRGPAGRPKIIYMPTLRGSAGSYFRLFENTSFDFDKIDKCLSDIGADFWVRLHPAQKILHRDLEKIASSKNIHYSDSSDDIYETIGDFDVLITDFSGIYFDFLITNRPIIMAPLMMLDYTQKDRELYYNYDDLCPDPPLHSWEDIVAKIRMIIEGGFKLSDDYFRLRDKFHSHTDSGSAARAVDEIKKLHGRYC
jgi:CDP-glycerol glycerophosphotransferase (TagB/SpsB family)